MEIDNQNVQAEEQNLKITQRMQNDLLCFAKWLKFFSVFGAIGLVLVFIVGVVCLIAGIIGTSFLEYSATMALFIGIFYLIIALLYIYPLKKAFGFIRKIRLAFSQKDNLNAEDAFQDLRQGLKFMGIFTIACLVLYVIALVVLAAAGIALSQLMYTMY